MQTMLYGVEMWGGSISDTMWDDIEKLQKSFIRKYLGVRITTPYSILLMDSGRLPIEYYGLIRTLRYIQKVRNMHEDRLPRQAWETCKRPKKNYKSKFLASGWMLDIKKWFAKWNMESFLEKEEMDWKEVEKAFKASLWEKWALSTKKSKFEYYCQNIMHYNKDAFIDAEGTTQAYLTAPLTRVQRSNLGKIRMRSHSLALEKGAWAGIPKSERLCCICKDMHAIEDEEHVLLKCSAYAHIRDKFSSIMKYDNKIGSFLNESPQKTLGIYVTKVLSHREHLLSLR